MSTVFLDADALLRGDRLYDKTTHESRPSRLILMILLFGPIYGAAMGSFRLEPDRLLQIVYAGIKVPLLLLSTAAICLPAFFVLNTVLGLRRHFWVALDAIVAGQAGLSICLASLAPFTRFFYSSSTNYRHALACNALMFTIATLAGHLVMLRQYRQLIAANVRHRICLYGWVVLYAFVGMQMGWTLRPFVGCRGLSVNFFRSVPFDNAYVHIARLFTNL